MCLRRKFDGNSKVNRSESIYFKKPKLHPEGFHSRKGAVFYISSLFLKIVLRSELLHQRLYLLAADKVTAVLDTLQQSAFLVVHVEALI